MEDRIKEVLTTYVVPLIEADGGHLEVVSIAGKQVTIRLSGACQGCPGRPYTVEGLIGGTLQQQVGEDVNVLEVP